MTEATLDATQADNHIIAWDDSRRHTARILVCKGGNMLVGVELLHNIRHLIYKPQQQTRLTTITVGYLGTLLALAVILIIILRKAIHPIVWKLLDYLQHTL